PTQGAMSGRSAPRSESITSVTGNPTALRAITIFTVSRATPWLSETVRMARYSPEAWYTCTGCASIDGGVRSPKLQVVRMGSPDGSYEPRLEKVMAAGASPIVVLALARAIGGAWL